MEGFPATMVSEAKYLHKVDINIQVSSSRYMLNDQIKDKSE